jgi:hypothetical protein
MLGYSPAKFDSLLSKPGVVISKHRNISSKHFRGTAMLGLVFAKHGFASSKHI